MQLISYLQEMWLLCLKGEPKGVFFWFSVYILIACMYSIMFQIRTRHWPYIPGELIRLELSKFGASITISDQDYKANALYIYSVSGKEYCGTRLSPWIILASHNLRFILEKQMRHIQRLPDGRIKVFYNPKKPQKSFLIIASKFGIFITFIFSIIPLTLFCFKYYF